MLPLTRLATAAASNGLLTGQILFSLAFVGSCELSNWINGPREANACLERWMTVSAEDFAQKPPLRHQKDDGAPCQVNSYWCSWLIAILKRFRAQLGRD